MIEKPSASSQKKQRGGKTVFYSVCMECNVMEVLPIICMCMACHIFSHVCENAKRKETEVTNKGGCCEEIRSLVSPTVHVIALTAQLQRVHMIKSIKC